jgi:hypothetical protein
LDSAAFAGVTVPAITPSTAQGPNVPKYLSPLVLMLFCVSVRAAGPQTTAPHWFTQPMSRLVVNPFMATPAPVGVPEPGLPVHAAYYAGEYPATLPFLWGWRVGGKARPVAIDDVQGIEPLLQTSASWAPSRLNAVADGATRMETDLVFSGTDGLIQRMRTTGRERGLIVMGSAPAGATPAWDAARHAVTWHTEAMAFALAVPDGRWIPTGSASTWAVGIDASGETVVSARFAPLPVDVGTLAAAAAGEVRTPEAFDVARLSEEAAWSARLARIPRATDFTLRILDADGVTPDAIRRRYDEAWAFILSDTLPPMPENGFPYPQVACGKPSLWGEGHPRARASAQWESVLGIQYLAIAEPDVAWDAFDGMMSLVDAEGTMNGEGLPSRHAETAWALYSRTGALDRLRANYPAIRRLLLWKARDPRWMHKGATGENTKDSEFVSSAMKDMGFAAKVALALDMPGEAAFWRRGQAELAADMRRWFWESPGGDPYEWYDADTGRRWGKDSSWTLESLALPIELLGAPQRDSLLRLFRAGRDDAKPFLVGNLTKQPNLSPTRDGLALHGRPEEAAALAEAQMRDITRADSFAETYNQETPLLGTGVRPSLFGALNIVDGVMYHNRLSLPGQPKPK